MQWLTRWKRFAAPRLMPSCAPPLACKSLWLPLAPVPRASSLARCHPCSLVKEKERNPGDDMLSEVGAHRHRKDGPVARAGRLLRRIVGSKLAPFFLRQSQIVKNDLRNGNITRDQLIAHSFLLVVRC